MPAPTSSRIPAAAQRLDTPVVLAPEMCSSLLGYLVTITDPRQRRGRRHTLGAVLVVAVAAVPAGAKSLPRSASGRLTHPDRSWPLPGMLRRSGQQLGEADVAALVAHALAVLHPAG